MAQQQSPWLEGAYGWSFGEGGWNTGMDSNLLKFSFLFDRNVDSIVASLPAAVNGQAHYLTTDNRLYFAVGTTYFSTPVPKWFVIVVRSTGQTHQFNGTSLVQIDTHAQLDSRLDDVELTVSNLGTAAFKDIEFFATQAELDVAEATAAAYTNTLRSDISNNSDVTKGATLVGFDSTTLDQQIKLRISHVVDSITSLKAIDKTKYTKVFVTGYYAAGDGGGGDYWFDATDTTSADNGGTTIVASDGGRWKLVVTGSVSVKQFGARGNSNGTTGNGADDTAFIQAAINYVKGAGNTYSLYIPEGVFRCTAQLSVDGAIRVFGLGVSPYDGGIGTRGNGSWVYFDHTGKGFNIDGTLIMSGIELSKFGTFRNQPNPAPAWTPNAHDYDIYIDNSDVYLDDMMLLNPTKGVFLTNGNAGRLEINRLRGQAFQTMVRVDTSFDAIKIHNLHQWPFWRDDSNVHAYTMSNLDALYLERSDNPMLTNIFTIFARAGIRFGQNVSGKTSKVHLANADFDRGAFGLFIDSTVTDGVTGQFDNITHQGEGGLAGSKAIFLQGNNSVLDFGNFRSDLADQNALRVDGTGNTINLAGSTVLFNYNQSASGFTAIEGASGNTIRIDGKPQIAGGGAGGRYSGAGLIYVDEWRAYSPTITAETGTITTVGTTVGRFKRFNDTLQFALDVTVTTNGTGAGSVRATVPDKVETMNAVATGREFAVGGKAVSGSLSVGTTFCAIRNFDNTYPASDGARLIVNGSYQIA